MTKAVLTLNNAQCQVSNLDEKIFQHLRETILYFDQAKFRRIKKEWLCKTYLIDYDGKFLTGLLPFVANFFKDLYPSIRFDIIELRVKPDKTIDFVSQLSEPPCYPDQDAALEACESVSKGILSMPTGMGKTRTFKELIEQKGVPTIVVPPSVNLKTQTYNYLHECFPSHTTLYSKKKDPTNIVVVNYHSLKNIPIEYLNFFDMLIYDEFHHSGNTTIRDIEKNKLQNIYYKFAFTATNFRNGGDDILMHSVLSNTIFHVPLIEAINKNYITPVQGIFYTINNEDLEICGKLDEKGKFIKDGERFQKDYETFIVTNEERNTKAVEIAKKMIELKIPTLILVKKVSHGLAILKRIPNAQFANSTTQKSAINFDLIDRFNAGNIPVLIGTSVIGEGVDTKRCGAVINLSGGKAKSELLQKVGRVVRRFKGKEVGFYFDFIDKGCESIRKQSVARKNIIKKEYGIKPKII